MLEHRGELFRPQPLEIQTTARRDVSKYPPLILQQTDTLIGLFYQGAIQNPEPATDYLKRYTMEYIQAAIDGSGSLYERDIPENTDVEITEAATHAFIVMAWMKELTTSPLFPVGFSRTGILATPNTRKEYLTRMRELQIGLARISAGFLEPHMQLSRDFSMFRVINFFKVGSGLPIKLEESQQKAEKVSREKFNDFLGDITTNF